MIHISIETSSLTLNHGRKPCIGQKHKSCDPLHTFQSLCLCYFVVFVGYHGLAALTIVTETAGYVCARSARGFGTGLEKPEFLLAFGAEWMETLNTLQSQIMEPI